MTTNIQHTFIKQLEGIDIPVYLGERTFNEEDESVVDVYKLGKGKRSGGVYRLQKQDEAFVIKFYEELSSYENDIAALNLLYNIIDDNPELKIGTVRQINPKFDPPKKLQTAHENDMEAHLDYIEGSTLSSIWSKLPKEFKNDVIQSIEKLESCFKEIYSKSGFTIETELRKRKGLLSHRKTPTLRMRITEPSGKCVRYCLHGGNFILTTQYQLVVIDPR